MNMVLSQFDWKRKQSYRSIYRQANVRPGHVLRALKWLLENSLYYIHSNVNICHNWLDQTILDIEQGEQLNNDDVDEEIDNLSNHSNELPVNKEPIILDNISQSSDLVDGIDENRLLNTSIEETNNEKEEDTFSEIDASEQNVQYNSLVEREEDPLYCDIAPSEGRKPVHVFYDKCMEEMCFPHCTVVELLTIFLVQRHLILRESDGNF